MSNLGVKQVEIAPRWELVKPRRGKQPAAMMRRGPAGPRTLRGKMKSRYNALKHGIFARVVLRGSVLREKRADYENLLQSFKESLQPQGGLEEFLVEKLAQLAWRKARAVRAEAALIMKQTEFLREDQEAQLKDASEGEALQETRLTTGIARQRTNPYVLRKAIVLLGGLKAVIAGHGFDPEFDGRILQSLYGETYKTEDVFGDYDIWSTPSQHSQEKSSLSEPDVEDCKRGFLRVLEKEQDKLRSQIRYLRKRQEKEQALEEQTLAILKHEELDRLLRYEARLDGAFDRTLSQLERVQRMRRGEPVPPTLKVDVMR